MKNQVNPLKPGDILVGNRSTTSNQPIWYQTVAASDRYITVRQIREHILSGNAMSGTEICSPNDYCGKPITALVRSQTTPFTRASSYIQIKDRTYRLWTGTPITYNY